MLGLLARRLAFTIPMLVVISFCVFSLIVLVPGDPAVALAGENPDPEQIAAVRERLGLDDPFLVQFWHWFTGVLQGDLGQTVQRLKQEPGEGLFVGGVTLPLALADLGLIDEYEFLVQPVLAGHGPTLLAGLRERVQLELVDRQEFRSGAKARVMASSTAEPRSGFPCAAGPPPCRARARRR